MAKIQVILLEDVAGQGRKGEIVSVSDGYAHNFLLKNKKAVLATAEELQKIENRKKKEAKKHEEERQKAIEVKKILEGKVLTSKEISSQIKEELNLDIDKKKIEANIKSLGTDEVSIKLFADVKAILKVNIVSK